METKKVVNLLNGSDNENSKFETKKWYVIDSESKGNYWLKNPIKFLINLLESSLCDYPGAYILLTGNITVTRTIAVAAGGDPQRKQVLTEATQVVFKNCRTEVNDTFVDYADFINITVPMYNLFEYGNNYSDTSESLWNLKRDEIDNNANVTRYSNARLFKIKAILIGNTETNGTKKEVKIAIPLEYLAIPLKYSIFWRSLEYHWLIVKLKFH